MLLILCPSNAPKDVSRRGGGVTSARPALWQLSSDLLCPGRLSAARITPCPLKTQQNPPVRHISSSCVVWGHPTLGDQGLDCPFMRAACFSPDTPRTPPHRPSSQEALSMLQAWLHSAFFLNWLGVGGSDAMLKEAHGPGPRCPHPRPGLFP